MKSQKTVDRMNEVRAELRRHHESIELMNAFAIGLKNLEWRVYKRTEADDARMRFTLKNIGVQVELLERELVTLKKYGA